MIPCMILLHAIISGTFRWYHTMESYPETRSRLLPGPSMIIHPSFASVIIKIDSDKGMICVKRGKLIVQDLKREEICPLLKEPKTLSFAARDLKRVRTPVIGMQCKSTHYSSYLLLTSVNDCFLKQAMPYQTAGGASFRRTLNSKYSYIRTGTCGVFRTYTL